MFAEFARRMAMLFRRNRFDADLAEEMRLHRDLRARDEIVRGASAEEAHYAAQRRFGNELVLREESRDMWGWNWLEGAAQDVRYGMRTLARSPGFAVVAVLTLALAIGANTSIFSVVDAVLLRPMPYRDAQRLVQIKEKLPFLSPKPVDVPAPDVLEFQRQNRTFSGVAGFQPVELELSGGGQPERITAARATSELFAVLGVAPEKGRTFTKQEDHPGSLVAVLSHRLWQSHFGGHAGIVGKTVELDRKPYLVIGVMREGFEFPLGQDSGQADLWVPMAFTPGELSDAGDDFDYRLVARLKPEVTPAQADADVQSIALGILDTYPASVRSQVNLGALTIPLRESFSGRVKTLLWILLGAVGVVLLIACANVGSLLLSRSVARQKEVALRAALGAGRWRLARQFLAESLLLSFTAGGLGLLLANWGARLLLALIPPGLPLSGPIRLDQRVLVFTLVVSALTGIIFGTAPATASFAADLNEALSETSRGTTESGRHSRIRSGLVVAETALSLILMIGAGLLMQTFARLLNTDPGFQSQHLLTFSLDLPEAKYQRGEDVLAFYEQLLDRLRAVPGVESATASSSFPLVKTNWNHIFTPEGYTFRPGEPAPMSWHSLTLGDYFRTARIPLVRGREFNDLDQAGSLPVVMVSESIARRYWPGQDPIGKRLKWGPPQVAAGSTEQWLTVVGVAGDVKQLGLDDKTVYQTYQPYLQVKDLWASGLGRALTVSLRASTDPLPLAAVIRSNVASLDRDLAIAHLETVGASISQTLAPQRFNLTLMAAFALLALVLGTVGLYALVSFSVTQRTHEVGLRMALGAEPGDVLRMVVGQGFMLTLIGVGIGIAGALAVTRFLSSLLYGVKPTDPVTFATVALALTLVMLIASYIPARRATKVDPMVALRHE